MTELKTLKDLTGMIGMLPLKSDILDINVVKQEAIKEIKLARDSKNGTKGLFGGEINFMFTKDVIGYIKWKFNIEEEEIK